MVIVFECSSEAKKALDKLMNRGQHPDYSDVINTAILNFAVLSATVEEKGSIVLPSADEKLMRVAESRSYGRMQDPPSTIPVGPDIRENKSHKPTTSPTIPPIFLGQSLPADPPYTPPGLPSDVFHTGQDVPVDRWVFGQYSKILPVKASCRALANLLLTQQVGFSIEKVTSQIAQEAAILGGYLEARDEQHGLIRDDALATGFPSTGAKADRSRLRYANQFVATMNKQGQVSGLLMNLKLINVTQDRARRIQLTKPGWTFAAMKNPVLDGFPRSPSDRFTEEERDFLVDHIAHSVPAEDFAYRTIIRFVGEGLETPTQLDDAVRNLPLARKDVTDAFITTQRSGVISRMIDLGLVNRSRDGVRVSYRVTDAGNKYASRSAAA